MVRKEYINSAEIGRRIDSAINRVKDLILDDNHELTDLESGACGRILMCIKSGVDGYKRSKEKHGRARCGGNTLRMAKDIMFLIACLSYRSKGSELGSDPQNVDLYKALEIMKEESIHGVPNLIVEEE